MTETTQPSGPAQPAARLVSEAAKVAEQARVALERRPADCRRELEVERASYALGYVCRVAAMHTRLDRVRTVIER
jgi:hypothetical protein